MYVMRRKNETFNHIITECGKLAQKEWARWKGKEDPVGIVQEIEFDLTIEWYMYKPRFVRGNKTHKIL